MAWRSDTVIDYLQDKVQPEMKKNIGELINYINKHRDEIIDIDAGKRPVRLLVLGI